MKLIITLVAMIALLIPVTTVNAEDILDKYMYAGSAIDVFATKDKETAIFTAKEGSLLHLVRYDLTDMTFVIEILESEYYIDYYGTSLLEQLPPTWETAQEPIEKQLANKVSTPEELRLLSALVYVEAGNQSIAGQQAVGIIVMNRIASELFPDVMEDVLYQKKQFYPRGAPRYEWGLGLYDSGQLPARTIGAALFAMAGNKVVTYQYIDYDLSSCLFYSRKEKKPVYKIQDHEFS